MARTILLAACLAGALAITGVLSTVAPAAEMGLPVLSVASSGTGSSGHWKFTVEGGAAIVCTSNSDTLASKAGSKDEGTATLDFSGCTEGGEPCNSLGDPSGVLLVSIEWFIVLIEKGGKDVHEFLIVLVSAEFHVECSKAAVKLLLLSGSLLGEFKATSSEPTTKYGIVIKDGSEEKGPQEFTEYENDKGEIVTAGLDTSQEGGKLKKSFANSETIAITFEKATSLEK